jgi:hypothetical protein
VLPDQSWLFYLFGSFTEAGPPRALLFRAVDKLAACRWPALCVILSPIFDLARWLFPHTIVDRI